MGQVSANAEEIRAPRQDRSRKTMDRVLESLEALLQQKAFDKITMVELAQKSGAGTSSIYARFKDKRSLVLGLHGRLAERVFPCLERLFDQTASKDKPLKRVVHANIASILRFYREHAQMVRAALLVDAPAVYERQIRVYHFAAEQFAALLRARVKGADPKALDRAADMSVRVVTGVIHQILIFQDHSLLRKPAPDRQVVEELTTAVWALLLEATGNRIEDE